MWPSLRGDWAPVNYTFITYYLNWKKARQATAPSKFSFLPLRKQFLSYYSDYKIETKQHNSTPRSTLSPCGGFWKKKKPYKYSKKFES